MSLIYNDKLCDTYFEPQLSLNKVFNLSRLNTIYLFFQNQFIFLELNDGSKKDIGVEQVLK